MCDIYALYYSFVNRTTCACRERNDSIAMSHNRNFDPVYDPPSARSDEPDPRKQEIQINLF
jgi:hypothetical protein